MIPKNRVKAFCFKEVGVVKLEEEITTSLDVIRAERFRFQYIFWYDFSINTIAPIVSITTTAEDLTERGCIGMRTQLKPLGNALSDF